MIPHVLRPFASPAGSTREGGGAGGEVGSDAVGAVRVVVVADLALVGEAVSAALRTYGFEVVTTAGPVGPAGAPGGAATVGLLMSDLRTPARLEILRGLVSRGSLHWLVLTGAPAGETWGAVLQAGASAVLPAATPGGEVVQALRRVALGDDLVGPAEREDLIRRWRVHSVATGRVRARLDELTGREREVLELLYRGASVRSIAERYAVSASTVRSQVRSVLRKLEVNSQLAAVAVWAEFRGDDPDSGGPPEVRPPRPRG